MKDIFPKAIAPPKLVKSYGVQLGYVAATITVVLAVLHLFRIDQLLLIIDKALPGGTTQAGLFVVVIVLAEVFAAPFLMRMQLSLLAQITSGFLVIFAPLTWLLLSIWTYGLADSTGQISQFVSTPSSILLITVNSVWLAFCFVTLWALGYNNLKIKKLLRK